MTCLLHHVSPQIHLRTKDHKLLFETDGLVARVMFGSELCQPSVDIPRVIDGE